MDFTQIFADDELAEEFLARREEWGDARGVGGPGDEGGGRPLDLEVAMREAREGVGFTDRRLEAIILRFGRPAFFVRRDSFDSADAPSSSAKVRAQVEAARELIDAAIPRVGRVELRNHRAPWVGTAWVVGPDLVITNRHVAQEFARAADGRFVFSRSLGRQASAQVNFRFEHQGADDAPEDFATVTEVLWMEPESGHDVALLRAPGVGQPGRRGPVELATDAAYASVQPGDWVSVVGYPARSRWNDRLDQQRIFEGVFDVKRLQPGTVTGKRNDGVLTHDCSTLGGNSGSVVLDLRTGAALSLHFGGLEGETNFSVSAPAVRHVIASSRRRSSAVSVPVDVPSPGSFGEPDVSVVGTRVRVQVPAGQPTVTVPLTLELEVAPAQTLLERTLDAADYDDRRGYDRDFLEERIDMPDISRAAERFGPAVRNQVTGRTRLDYTHFTVVMCARRRLAYFTAVNINGERAGDPQKNDVDWANDGRIDRGEQAQNWLYRESGGDYFQRGHLVRRLDPVWGSRQQRQQANDDTYHWTNCAPQHLELNTGWVWRTIEDRILDTLGDAKLRASVFTGPVFHEDDEVHRAVQIPRAYFKIVVHEKPGGGLATAGWVVRQDDAATDIPFEAVDTPTSYLPVEPTRLREIEAMTGLRFDRVMHDTEVGPSHELASSHAAPTLGPLPVCKTLKPRRSYEAVRGTYGAPEAPDRALEGATYEPILWDVGQTLRVRFLDGTPKQRARVCEVARTWERFANLTFDFGEHPDGSEIRVSFEHLDSRGRPDGYWSQLGRYALDVPEDEPTLCLSNGWTDEYIDLYPDHVRGTILHELGHAIGLIHEHQSPSADIPWNVPVVYWYYREHEGWDRATVDDQVLTRYGGADFRATAHDPDSIVQYPVDESLTHGRYAIGWNETLSVQDRRFVAELYPFA